MKRALCTALLVVLLASVVAADGWRNLTGSAAPEISADTWLNVNGKPPSTENLEGRAWLLVFFGVH